MKISRRNFLAGAVAAVAGALLPKAREVEAVGVEAEPDAIVELSTGHETPITVQSGQSFIDGYCEGLKTWTEFANDLAALYDADIRAAHEQAYAQALTVCE